jgi:hypothetical protein
MKKFFLASSSHLLLWRRDLANQEWIARREPGGPRWMMSRSGKR